MLADLKRAAAAKWRGDSAAQQWGLFARAAAEIERLRAELAAERELCAAVCDSYAAENQRLHDEIERLRAGHDRYELVRRMNVDAFRHAYVLNWRTGKPFDQIVDELAAEALGRYDDDHQRANR